MKLTGKTLTLSGQMPKRSFNQQLFRDPYTILEYANVLDINKAWRLKDFKCWIQEDGRDLGVMTENATFGLDVQLSTDDIPNSADWNNAGDNRAVAWGTLAYALSDTYAGKTQAFSGFQRMLLNSEYFVQPEHVIQNKLTISAASAGQNSEIEGLTGYTLNYLVYLEEIEITPSESIIYNIKGKAQDVS